MYWCYYKQIPATLSSRSAITNSDTNQTALPIGPDYNYDKPIHPYNNRIKKDVVTFGNIEAWRCERRRGVKAHTRHWEQLVDNLKAE